MKQTNKLTISALCLALGTVLMWVSKLIPAPWLQGGSVTLFSMVPIIGVGVMFGTKWGLCTSISYSVIQMMFGFYPPPTQTFMSFLLVVLLDYVIAFGVLGLSGLFYRIFKRHRFSIPLSGFIVTFMRYVCHILSGVLIWGVYAEEGQTVLMYSLIYNGTYMIPEILLTTAALAFLSKMRIFTSDGDNHI